MKSTWTPGCIYQDGRPDRAKVFSLLSQRPCRGRPWASGDSRYGSSGGPARIGESPGLGSRHTRPRQARLRLRRRRRVVAGRRPARLRTCRPRTRLRRRRVVAGRRPSRCRPRPACTHADDGAGWRVAGTGLASAHVNTGDIALTRDRVSNYCSRPLARGWPVYACAPADLQQPVEIDTVGCNYRHASTRPGPS